MELRGERVVLRSLTEGDRHQLIRIHATPEVAEFWGDEEFEPDAGSDDEPVHQLAILLDGRVVGYIQGYEQLAPQDRYACSSIPPTTAGGTARTPFGRSPAG